MIFYYDISMNNLSLSSINSRSIKDQFDFPSIRDSIFYFEDLMDPNSNIHETGEKTIVSILNEENNPIFLMNTIFDETMINHKIESKARELEIKQLLESIEAFHHEDPKDF